VPNDRSEREATDFVVMKTIFFLGPFPPPVRGMPIIFQAVYERLRKLGIPVHALNTAYHPNVNQSLNSKQLVWYKSLRGFTILKRWFFLILRGRSNILYMPFSGGRAQIYDWFTVLVARLLQMQIVIHHHSVAYLHWEQKLPRLIFDLAGRDSVHIVLCDFMKAKLARLYGIEHIILLSNMAFFDNRSLISHSNRTLKTAGFLSNITTEKGGWTVLRLAEEIQKHALGLQVLIAGPCLEDDLRFAIETAQENGWLKYLGPVYGDDKHRFFESIDVFTFPTAYRNEAEPLVLWEAMKYGIPVIANQRGCIQEQLDGAGFDIRDPDAYIAETLRILEHWRNDPLLYQSACEQMQTRYQRALAIATAQWEQFVNILYKMVETK